MFLLTKINVSESEVFYFLDIENYSNEFIQLIDSEICKIWDGDEDKESDINVVKSQIKNLLDKKDKNKKHGLIAEFICHLFLRSLEYNQHFLFQNLEESSMKKGFDGLYKKDGEMWLFESKSSYTKDSSHEKRIKEAYNDLLNKVEGNNTKNPGYNPWRNAYNHANIRSVKYDETIIKSLSNLSKMYSQKEYSKIDEFNIMPSSTIYLGDEWCQINVSSLTEKLKEDITGYRYKKIHIICVNKKDINSFIDYING